MISVNQAIAIVQNGVEPTSQVDSIDISTAHRSVLRNDIVSEINMPPFRQSAMDGYALCLHEDLTYKLIGEVKAGDPFNPRSHYN